MPDQDFDDDPEAHKTDHEKNVFAVSVELRCGEIQDAGGEAGRKWDRWK
jgi:hypothetical protein